jgi:hypothetical protein
MRTELQNLTAGIALPDRPSNPTVIRIDSPLRFAQLPHHAVPFVETEIFGCDDRLRRDDMEHPEFCLPDTRNRVCPLQGVRRNW